MARIRRPFSVGSLWKLLRFRGPGYLVHLLRGHLLPPCRRRLLLALGPDRLGRIAAAGWLERRRRRREARRATGAGGRDRFLAWEDWPVDEAVRRAVDAAGAPPSAPRGEIVLGQIDADGRLASPWGAFPGFEAVDSDVFVPRTRFSLDLVLLDGRVLIRKDYRGRRDDFLDEWYVLTRVEGKANVPSVYDVREERCLLYRSFIPGETINDRLVEAGARIRLAETRGDPSLDALDGEARLEAVLERGTRRLADAVPAHTLEEMERQLDRIHRCGVARLSLTFGNVVLEPETGAPWLVDFDGAEAFRSTRSELFACRRDLDRERFNRFYGRSLLTESGARALLRRELVKGYAPIDLGRGMTTRGFWSVDSGTGRWEFFLQRALTGLVEDRRILDLGSHHGLLPLLMLAAGARQVVAVEKSAELAAAARHLHRLFEWRDMRRYDLDLRRADMRAICDGDWGRFDLVTSFCSLYYLDEADMARVVRKAAELAPMLVVQAKVDTRPQAADGKAAKSSLGFLRGVLEANGFPRVELAAPKGYSRPLLIGRRR